MEPLGDVTDEAEPAPARPTTRAGGPDGRPDRIIGGVAGAIGVRLGVDPLWVRLGFVVLGLAGGIGVVVYAAWWLVLVAGSWSRSLRIVGGALLVAGVPALVAGGPRSFVTGPLAVVLLLTGLALALWQPRQPSPGPDLLAAPALTPWSAPRPPSEATAAPAPPRPPRERSMLGRITLGLAASVGAAWALADQLDGGRLHPEQWLGAAAAVCGGGMLVGTFRGRARWLLVPAILTAGVGYASGTMARMGIRAGDLRGDQYVWIGEGSRATDIDARRGIGDIQIDVSGRPASPVHVDARVAFGTLHVTAAEGVTVEVRGRTDHGSLRTSLPDTVGRHAGVLRLGDGAEPDVVIDAWVGRGDIEAVTYAGWPGAGGPPLPETTIAALTVPPLPPEAGGLVPIGNGIAMTIDGWVVLGNGEALIDPDDEVTTTSYGTPVPEADGSVVIDTSWGPFRLLPRSLLLTPDSQVLDLRALRNEVASGVTTTSAPSVTTTMPGVTETTPAITATVPVTVPITVSGG